jgi:hypothetical protein
VGEQDTAAGRVVGQQDVPPLPTPWRPASETGPPLRGCGKPLLLGCGCGTLVVVASLALFAAKAPELVAWSVGMWQRQVTAGLPAEVSPEERARLTAAFDAFPAAVGSGLLTMERMFEVFGEINDAITAAQRGELSREGVLRLIDALERANASAQPGPDEVRAGAPPGERRRTSGVRA